MSTHPTGPACSAEQETRAIPVREFTTDLGAVYEAVAEIVPRHGAPVIVAHQYATTHDVTPTAWLITTPTEMRLEFRDERAGHVLARDAVRMPEPPRPTTGDRSA